MKQILTILLVAVLIGGCGIYAKETEQTRELMGTYATIKIVDRNKAKSVEAMNAAFDEIKRIESMLSIYSDETEAYKLNEKGFLNDAGDELIGLIQEADQYSELSEGAFDITVQPILDLYKNSFKINQRPPSDEEIKETLKLVDYKGIIIDNKDIRMRKDMKITLGGIAKGYAVDSAIEILKEHGIKNALVNAGGDIRALGTKGDGTPWSIALRNPNNKEEYITIIKLDGKAVTTSGNYERYFDGTKKFHHIVDPRTGYSATELISVTIITNKAIDADALSTSVFVLGAEKGLELIESLDNVEGLLITSEKEIIRSSGFEY